MSQELPEHQLPGSAYSPILNFWFLPAGHPGEHRAEWFRKDAGFDDAIRQRFADLVEEALQGRFAYLPFEHSESMLNQERSVALFEALRREAQAPAFDGVLDYAVRHRTVIERFGRFPHRNVILGRPSTPEEIEFLRQPGSSF